ncbi:Arm DNA-binding domain-containing protein [Amaricoccus sp. W119]|uniref:Arm DNA-binding domain-containing protein n=1 Tax=Amaricoccus sp. W119 TaxID=3391833 RepID=UPI0039A57CCF
MCRKAPPREKNCKLTDGRGLHPFVQTNGSRYWRVNYRDGGRQRTASFGVYPLPQRRLHSGP